MNTAITSREAILAVTRQLIREKGWSAVSIRAVAAAGNISVGSIYNYFDSKSELVAAAVESVWFDIFHPSGETPEFSDFLSCIAWVCGRLRNGQESYPGFFQFHAMSFSGTDRTDGQLFMARSWQHIQDQLLAVLRQDSSVRFDAFDTIFTPEKLMQLIFSSIFFSLLRKDYDSSVITETVRRLIY